MRIKRGVIANKRRKNILKKTKGYKYGRKNKYKLAVNAWIKAKTYAYRDRRNKKRVFRRLWNIKINAGLKLVDEKYNYSRFVKALKDKKIELDRKVLSDLAENDFNVFKEIVLQVMK